jgi:hypothetical protein
VQGWLPLMAPSKEIMGTEGPGRRRGFGEEPTSYQLAGKKTCHARGGPGEGRWLPVILCSGSGGAQMQRQNFLCSCQNNFLQLAPLILSNNLLICVRLNALPFLHLDLLPLFFPIWIDFASTFH